MASKMEEGARLKLPRGYLSHSQITSWKYNKGQYMDHYVYDISKAPSKEMLFGSRIGKLLETGNWENEPTMIQKILGKIPRYDSMEHPLKMRLATKKGSFDLIGYADSYHTRFHKVREYKTGRVPWDQKRADKHLQALLYAGILYKKTGLLPQMWIDWMPTHVADGEIAFVNMQVHTFKVNLTVGAVLEALKEAQTIALEIHEWYSAYEKTLAEVANA